MGPTGSLLKEGFVASAAWRAVGRQPLAVSLFRIAEATGSVEGAEPVFMATEGREVPFSPYPPQYLLFVALWMTAF